MSRLDELRELLLGALEKETAEPPAPPSVRGVVRCPEADAVVQPRTTMRQPRGRR